jgi:hypothetical protein
MNGPQYGCGTQQSFHHQEVAPAQQQYVASNSGEGVVVMANASVHYHCTGANNHSEFNTLLDGKPVTNDTRATNHQQNSCVHSYSAGTSERNSEVGQSYNMHNPMPQKVDASTMTEKETQTTSDGLFGGNVQQQDCKPSYPIAAMIPSPATWQSLAGPPGSTVAEYLSRLPASTLPLTLHHFLKFSSAATTEGPAIQTPATGSRIRKEEDGTVLIKKKKKRKYKKKPYIPRPPRPRPGEVRLTTALDGSTLYCCPECHMAYPERELLEQHLVVHRLERRFVCDICGAGLKRKEHLDRHKQGHNPERPYACSVCLKAFKRNEHLSRHFVIHSGDKTQVCTECGKGFYRKDHLRKHAQSHIAKRLRAELMGQKRPQNGGGNSQQGIGPLGSMAPSSGITAVALMPGGATLRILSS